jgi:hypothetical protein
MALNSRHLSIVAPSPPTEIPNVDASSSNFASDS